MDYKNTNQYRNKLKKIFIILSTAGLLYFVINSINISEIKPSFSGKFYIYSSMALIFILFSIIMGCLRWFCLLKKIDKSLIFSDVFSVYYMSNSISTYVPGMLIGDYYRYLLISKKKVNLTSKYDTISYTILVDRILSLLSLIINVCMFTILFIDNSNLLKNYIEYILYALIFFSLIIIFIYKLRSSIIRKLFLYEGFGGIKAYNFLKYINKNKFQIFILLLFSLIANYSIIISYYFIIKAYNLDLNFIASSTSLLLAFFGALVPISPSGLGVSEYIYNEIYNLITNQNINIIYIYVAFRFATLIVNAPSIILIVKEGLQKIIIMK